jgi:folate-dependent phosphoribosylglycinamide formyltransferase PurN
MALKIVVLTDNSPAGRYTANLLHARHGIDLVVMESAKRRLFLADLKRFGARETLYRTRLVLRRLIPAKLHLDMLDRYFGGMWRNLDPSIAVLTTDSVNGAEVTTRLAEIGPDIVVCHGTTMVRDSTVAGIRFPLNIHYGLSPWYRGSRCTEWALATGDVLNIGVTVHRLTKDIDGGAVLGQTRIEVTSGDDVATINSKIAHAGVAIASDAIGCISRGENPQFVAQPSDAGMIFWRRQFSRFLARHVEELLQRNELAHMLKNPSAPLKPLLAPWPPARPEAARLEPAEAS